jgi:predicted lipoprotein with Yx(FWY)xxD motif
MSSIRPASVIAALALGACGSATHATDPTTVTRTTATPATTATAVAEVVRHIHRPRGAPTVRVRGSAYGRALTDTRGFALYRFTHDRSSRSTCHGGCAAAWPPYIVKRRPTTTGRGARASLLGSVRRSDGRLQVTYAGHPLYYYVGDRRAGQVLCQAVTEFGGTWYVVAPDGRAIR